jgi:SPP1 family predicted phage head-tail adaptor
MNVNLDRRISIDARTVTQDTTNGSEVVTWVLLATVYAEVRDALPSRSESVQQGLVQRRNQVRIRIRYRGDFDSTARVRYGSRTLQIVGGPSEIGRREYEEIVCEEYASTGGAA